MDLKKMITFIKQKQKKLHKHKELKKYNMIISQAREEALAELEEKEDKIKEILSSEFIKEKDKLKQLSKSVAKPRLRMPKAQQDERYNKMVEMYNRYIYRNRYKIVFFLVPIVSLFTLVVFGYNTHYIGQVDDTIKNEGSQKYNSVDSANSIGKSTRASLSKSTTEISNSARMIKKNKVNPIYTSCFVIFLTH